MALQHKVREDAVRNLVRAMADACAEVEPEPQMDDLVSAGFTFAAKMMETVLEKSNCPENREVFRATLQRMLLSCADPETRN